METDPTLASVITVVSFVTFVAIMVWAWSKRRRSAFEAAANAPFALPDDIEGSPGAENARAPAIDGNHRGRTP